MKIFISARGDLKRKIELEEQQLLYKNGRNLFNSPRHPTNCSCVALDAHLTCQHKSVSKVFCILFFPTHKWQLLHCRDTRRKHTHKRSFKRILLQIYIMSVVHLVITNVLMFVKLNNLCTVSLRIFFVFQMPSVKKMRLL